jgi:predicted alpha/beta hydrolase
MLVKHEQVPSSDGHPLTVTTHLALGQPDDGRVVVIASAIGVRRRYYGRYASYLASRGVTTVTFDFRGIGDSKPASLRGFDGDLLDWGEKDLNAVIAWCRHRFPRARLAGVGHSMGGQLFGLAATSHEIDSLLTVGTQSGYWRHWRGLGRVGMLALYWLMPLTARALGYFPAKRIVRQMEDLPAGVAEQWAAWGLSPKYLASIDRPSLANFGRSEGRLLAYSFSDDSFAPRSAVDWLAALYRKARAERRHLSPAEIGVTRISHFGFFREEFRDSLWPESADWLTDGSGLIETRAAADLPRAAADGHPSR